MEKNLAIQSKSLNMAKAILRVLRFDSEWGSFFMAILRVGMYMSQGYMLNIGI